jgi:hypothetical protein
LDSDPALHCIHNASESGQQIVPQRVYQSTPVLLDEGEHDLLVLFQSIHRRRLILPHEAAVNGYIGAENSGQLSLKLFCIHGITPTKRKSLFKCKGLRSRLQLKHTVSAPPIDAYDFSSASIKTICLVFSEDIYSPYFNIMPLTF